MKALISGLLLLLISISPTWSQIQLVPAGSDWKFQGGTAEPWNWKMENFNDNSWQTGTTQMGYGDGDEATVLYSGPDWGNFKTYYFRKKIIIPDTSLFPGGYEISVKKDDGIIFYINGVEIYRNNINALTPAYTDPAPSACLEDGNTWLNFYIPQGLLHPDTNTLSAEIHQFENTYGDLSFDCMVNGISNTVPICTRGPYLQSSTPNSLVIKWRTNIKSNSKIKLGSIYNVFTDSVMDANLVYNHEVKISGLTPATQYYYTIGSFTSTSVQDTGKYFYTPSAVGTPYELDIWVTGDCGTGYLNQINTANAFSNFVGNKYMDSWVILGDNAYLNGLDIEYQTNFFDVYKQYRFLGQSCIWPTPGNHDYNNTGDLNSRNTPYFQIFTVPDSGQAGGIVSGTESYYSYNLANAHFISLDSYGTESSQKMYDTTSAQAQWLQQDLAANTQPWTVVYWHHPPYSKGNHNSDTETELIEIRSKLLKVLERYKVDLVLCGHSHQYERSKLMKGHYGLESTFDSLVHDISSSSARYDGSSNSCPYYKETSDSVNTGIVYVVSGNAGKYNTNTSPGWPHNAMYYSNTSNSGSIYLKIDHNRLDAKFISETGIIQDQFTMMKDVNNTYQIMAPMLTPINLTASWPGNYYWEGIGDTTQTVNIAFDHDSVLVVHDPFECIADTFFITTYYIGIEENENLPVQIYPNPTTNDFYLKTPILYQQASIVIFNTSGQQVFQEKWPGNKEIKQIEPGKLAPGIYFIRIVLDKKIYYKKLVFN